MAKLMTKTFDICSMDKSGPVYTIDGISSPNWEQPTPALGVAISETYFDLAGMSKQEKTLFFNAAAVQEVSPPSHVGGAAGDLVTVTDVMSSIPLTFNQVFSYATLGNTERSAIPNFESQIYARHTIYVIDLDFQASGYFNVLSSNQLGSMMPTAADRIYCYRLFQCGANNAGTTFNLFPARYLLSATAQEEKEYEYLMRLKKSYDLQQSFDVDGNRPH